MCVLIGGSSKIKHHTSSTHNNTTTSSSGRQTLVGKKSSQGISLQQHLRNNKIKVPTLQGFPSGGSVSNSHKVSISGSIGSSGLTPHAQTSTAA